MTIDIREKLKNIVLGYGRYLLALAVVLLLVHDVFGTHGFLAMRKKQQELEKVTAELGRLNKENDALQQEQQDLKSDPQTIRKIAREELLLAEPGEIIIKLPPGAIDAGGRTK
jgi:cell division protein FtsL